MITGIVNQLEALVELDILDAANRPSRVRTVIDTGYNGFLLTVDAIEGGEVRIETLQTQA